MCSVRDNISIWVLRRTWVWSVCCSSYLQGKPAGREDAKLKEAEFYWLACNASVPADSTMVRKNSHQKFCCLTASRISMHSCAVEAGIGMEVLTHFIALTKIWFVCVMMLAVINLSGWLSVMTLFICEE
ncbi:hypothetical protein BGI30_07370 [Snodgrassella alvi]|uniref:hypothetical protein n=1 Tax=Snodgrassella alvi TaxID=1196083 RepID=UPI000C1ED568|nr:hypothetical protein [Snodgrassella alvi]PIT10064.1 hypothetical protein BGI30_07370 [Snodgrassella alvi]PIT57270.1 hypothetical protein BHC59_05060 [Snodgrassella alvi]